MALAPGAILDGKYRIGQVLGEGGMGTVYGGEHTKIRRRVAIKVLKAALAQDKSMVERFEREAMAASAVRSPHVVEIFDVGALDSGEHYIIMERLDGESLSERLKRERRLSPAAAFGVASQLLDGLGAAHAQGIVHRDLKPANVHISSPAGTVKVLDFGVSKFSELSSGEGFTHTGAIVGTPHYMSPEQTKGARHADHRSDLYAVGAILFRALTGHVPLRAETIHELIAKLISTSAPSIQSIAPMLDDGAASVVDRALRSDPAQRFQQAAEMKAAVDAWLSSGGAQKTQKLQVLHPDDATEPKTEAWNTPHSSDLHAPPPPRMSSPSHVSLATPVSLASLPSFPSGSYAGPAALSGRPQHLSVTPSPSAFDAHPEPARGRGVGLIVGLAFGALAITAVGAAWLADGEPAPVPTKPAQPAAVATQTAPAPSPAEPVASVAPAPSPAEPVASVAPAPSASTKPNTAQSAERLPAIEPSPARPGPKPAPLATPKPSPTGRDYRTDI